MRGCFDQFSRLNPVKLHTGRRCEIFSQVNSFDPRVIFEKQRWQPSGYGQPPCVHKQVQKAKE